MRVLVTGSAGFIGNHVCNLLRERGHDVLGVDAYLPQVHGYLREWRVRDWEAVMQVGQLVTDWGCAMVVAGFWDHIDAVIHLAAAVGVGQSTYQPAHYVEHNVLETAKLWERVVQHKNIRKVVIASSMSLYGEGAYLDDGGLITGGVQRVYNPANWNALAAISDGEPVSASPAPTSERKIPEPASVYAQTKYDAERYSLLLGEAYRVPTVALRFFNAYGPGQALGNAYTGFLANCAARVLNGKPPLLYEDGLQSRDFIHVSDIARAVVMAAEAPELSGVFNVCTGTQTTVLSLAEQWCQVAAERGLPRVKPQLLNTYRVGDVRHCYGDPTKLRDAIGFSASMEPKDGLRDLAGWLVANGYDQQKPEDRVEQAHAELRERGLER